MPQNTNVLRTFLILRTSKESIVDASLRLRSVQHDGASARHRGTIGSVRTFLSVHSLNFISTQHSLGLSRKPSVITVVLVGRLADEFCK